MIMKKIAADWAEFVEELNGCPVTLDDVSRFCREHATSYEEFNAMYELLADQVDEEEMTDYCEGDFDECGYDPYAGCYTDDC